MRRENWIVASGNSSTKKCIFPEFAYSHFIDIETNKIQTLATLAENKKEKKIANTIELLSQL